MLDTSSVFRVDGIVAVITGGGTGIGWMMAEALATNGAAKVFLLGRREDVLAQAAARYPDIMVPIPCDVTSLPSLEAAAAAVARATSFVNLLLANSGVGGTQARYNPALPIGELRAHLLAAPMDAFTHTFHVNVTGAYFTMVAFLELLDAGNKHAVSGRAGVFGAPAAAGGGKPSVQSQVVFTASLAGFSRGYWTPPDYGGSKAAVIHLAKQAATNLAPYGIRVNALAPGLFPSELASGLIASRNPEEEDANHALFIPAQKFGGEEEMAGAILYLASRAGSFTNGNVMLCDGGRSAVIPSSY